MYTPKCGGSIISEDVILTAAHCVTNESRILVRMGHSNIYSEESFDLKVKSILTNIYFRNNLEQGFARMPRTALATVFAWAQRI